MIAIGIIPKTIMKDVIHNSNDSVYKNNKNYCCDKERRQANNQVLPLIRGVGTGSEAKVHVVDYISTCFCK